VPVRVVCEFEITSVLVATAEIDDLLEAIAAVSDPDAFEADAADEVPLCPGELETGVEDAGTLELEAGGVVEVGGSVEAGGVELVEGSGVGDVESGVVVGLFEAVLPESLDEAPVLAEPPPDADCLFSRVILTFCCCVLSHWDE
jgi:hypothetical protein